MSNPWSREYADEHADDPHGVEVELTHVAVAAPPRPDSPPPTGRRRPGRATVIAVVAALLATIVAVLWSVVGDDDASSSPPASTVDPVELSERVTTPPTLPGSAVAPSNADPDTPELSVPAFEPAPLFPTLDFETVAGVSPDELAAYDLTAAVERNVRGDQPMRSMFTVDGDLSLIGDPLAGEPALTASAATDPAAGRDELTIQFGTTTNQIVVDRPGGQAFTMSTSQGAATVQWAALTEEQLLEGTGATSTGELFDTFVSGPISPATLAAATVTPSDDVVRMAGGAFARRFDLDIPIEALRPYGALLLATITDGTTAQHLVPATLRFQVYVTDQPALALVVSQFDVGDQPRLFTQFFDRVPANVLIELPPPESIISAD